MRGCSDTTLVHSPIGRECDPKSKGLEDTVPSTLQTDVAADAVDAVDAVDADSKAD